MSDEGGQPVRERRYGLSFKLDPTDVQAGWFARSAGSRRWCYNRAVALVQENSNLWQAQRAAGVDPKQRVKPLSAMDLRNALKQDRPEWLRDMSVWVLEFAAVDAAAAAQGFLAGRTRFPTFAKKGKSRERWTEWGRPCQLAAGTLRLPKIGQVRIASADPAQAKLRRLVRRGRAEITSVTIARHADGTWWASCKVRQQLRSPQPAGLVTSVVGVDRGIKTAAVAATADGTGVLNLEAGQYLRRTSRKLARAQRTVSRRPVRGQASSANRKKAVASVGRLHERVAQQRRNALHTFSSALVTQHPCWYSRPSRPRT